MKKVILLIVALAAIIFVTFKSPLYTYYKDTYKGSTAYSVVPKEVPIKEQTKDQNGAIVPDSYSYNYTFTFIKEDGSKQVLPYELAGENVTPFEPGKLITAEISKNRILTGPNSVKKNKIPEKALAELAHN